MGGGGYEVLCFDWDSGPLPEEGEGHVEFPYLRWAGDTWSFLTWGGGEYVKFLPEVGGGYGEFPYLKWAGHEKFLPEVGGGTWSFLTWGGRGTREVESVELVGHQDLRAVLVNTQPAGPLENLQHVLDAPTNQNSFCVKYFPDIRIPPFAL